MKKALILGVILLIVIGGYYYFATTKIEETVVYASDTTIEGDAAVLSGEQTTITNAATLTVKGNFDVTGTLACANGPLKIVVEGNTTISGIVRCVPPEGASDGDTGISIVTNGLLTVSEDAEVISNGSVQIVDDERKLARSDEDIEAVFNETSENTGTGTRIGPMIESGVITGGVTTEAAPPESALPYFAKLFGLVNTAHAQTALDKDGNPIPGVVISGTWTIGEGGAPPAGVAIEAPGKKIKKIVLNFNFGNNSDVTLQDFHLVGPKGRTGDSDIGTSCNARGKDGEDAFRFRVQARNITLNTFRLELGDGGDGGPAETPDDCDPGIARGGNGGAAGNFKMTAEGSIQINAFHIVPGRGGSGGTATANGKDGEDGCPGKKGGDATATGGDGGKNKKELAAAGAVSGIGNVTIDTVIGGLGGEAIANPGKGGNGNACKCNGGAGGKGTATGGKGGDASLSGITGTSQGGDGGDADAHGGVGGNGGSCSINQASGGNGGKGGDAKSTFGVGGNAGARGADGTVADETGGNGGNGGDGCGPGGGGKGGAGKPPGSDGAKGKIICSEEEPKTAPDTGGTGVIPGSGTGTTGGSSGGSTAPAKLIQAIQYQGKYLPREQLIIEDEIGCGTEHWHAARGAVIATDGTAVSDPGPQCGYGKLSDVPLVQVEVQ